ncbi:MAG: beta-mannosidase [Ruminococcus sp.]|nr:beta-mannosidase [Ruminococcus sp.]
MKGKFKKAFSLVAAAAMSAVAITSVLPAYAEKDPTKSETTKFPYTIEGEDLEGATLWESIYENKIDGYSGKGFTYLTSDALSFKVTVPEDGMYQITVRGAQILSEEGRLQTVAINGVEYSKTVPYYKEWTDIDFGVVRLRKGENEISFLNKYGYMAIDTVTVSDAVFPDITKASGVPCDPNATPETKALMKYLHSVYGKGILSGQQEIYGGGHSVSTDIRYDAGSDKCVDGKGNEYVIDRDSEAFDKDGNKFYWHCSDDKRTYTYDEQNRNYKYDYYDQEFDYIKETAGYYPAIRGFDFMNYNPLYGWDDGSTERAIDWVKNRNGIITASWHINLPTDFDNYELGEAVDWSKCSYKNNSQFKIANAVKEGTKENDYLNLAIADLAEQFLILQENNVPIMFRPFHEAEGNGGADGSGAWFWWAQDGAKDYKELWKYLYNKLTDEYGLHNIIWLQNLYAWSDESAEWYVGDEYVDIVGFDKYDTVYNRHDGLTSGPNEDCNSNVYWSLVDYVKNNKMAAVMENSTIPSLANMTVEKASWLYFCTWYDNGQDNFISGDNYNNPETVKELIASDYCINLEELPEDLYSFSGGEDTPKTTTTGKTTGTTTTTITTTTTVTGGISVSESMGDVNIDGKVSLADAVLIMQSLANPDDYKLSEQGVINADVVDSGSGISPADALAIQMIDLKKISVSDLPITSADIEKIQ